MGGSLADHFKFVNGFNRKATPRWFCMSVDLKKAFDMVSWVAIEKTLEEFSFSKELREILRQCYRTLSLSVLVDGEPMTRFLSQRGLRQGDPFLQIVFNLMIETCGL